MDLGRNYRVWASRVLVTIAIPLFAHSTSVANVRLAFDSTSLDFGTVAVNGTKDLTLNVLDTSTSAIEIDAITPTGPNAADFAILSPTTPVVISAGQAIATQIIIRFRPQATGTRSALLQIETTDGVVILPMTGIGAGNQSSLQWAVNTVDFGLIAPGAHRDSAIELYSNGTDTAFISELEITAADTSFIASILNGPQPPFKLAPGDSALVQIALQGLPPAGTKNAQLTAIGSTENTPACNLTTDVEFGGFTVTPSPTIDFGAMYDGQVRDTSVAIVNTSTLDLDFEDLSLSPGDQDFSILNSVPVPFILHAGETLTLHVRANPGAGLMTTSQLQALSPSAANRYASVALTVASAPAHISAQTNETISYSCASGLLVSDSNMVTNSDTQAVVLTGLECGDTSVAVQALTSMPDTIQPGSSNMVRFAFDASTISSDTLVLELMGGRQTMWFDTVILNRTIMQAAPTLVMTSGSTNSGRVQLSTNTSLLNFGLDSMVIHLSSLDTNSAVIDPATIHLDSAFANDTIVSIELEPGGYRVVVRSSKHFSAEAGNSILDFGIDRFLSSSDTAAIVTSIETPQRAGCLVWAADTLNTGVQACGTGLLRDVMLVQPVILNASLAENPVVSQNVSLHITASEANNASYEISNALGQTVSAGTISLDRGVNTCILPVDMPSGSYVIHLFPHQGISKFVPFVKLR